MKQLETAKTSCESNEKQEKDRCAKLEKELNMEKKEKRRWESKVSDLDSDLNVSDKVQYFKLDKMQQMCCNVQSI